MAIIPIRHPCWSALFALLVGFFLTACQSVYYETMEKFGYEKRDLLVNRVDDARIAQQQAKKQFQSALEQFSAVTHFDGGQLREKYDKLKDAVYKRRGWTSDGIPTLKTVKRLGIDYDDVVELLKTNGVNS